MKKILILFAASALVASSPLLAYWVVLKDGTRYESQAKPTVSAGKAMFSLKNGQVIQVAADAIDNAKSEEATSLGGGIIIAREQRPAAPAKTQSSLGSSIRLRRQLQPQPEQQATPPVAAPAPPSALGADVIDKFERAYENVGICEHKMPATGGRTLRADITTD